MYQTSERFVTTIESTSMISTVCIIVLLSADSFQTVILQVIGASQRIVE